MKERSKLKDIGFIIKSAINPFGAVRIKVPKGSHSEVIDLSDEQVPLSAKPRKKRKGRILIPTGSSAKVIVRKGGRETSFTINDYRERTGHTPGAKITSKDRDIKLDSRYSEVEFDDIGHIVYEK